MPGPYRGSTQKGPTPVYIRTSPYPTFPHSCIDKRMALAYIQMYGEEVLHVPVRHLRRGAMANSGFRDWANAFGVGTEAM